MSFKVWKYLLQEGMFVADNICPVCNRVYDDHSDKEIIFCSLKFCNAE